MGFQGILASRSNRSWCDDSLMSDRFLAEVLPSAVTEQIQSPASLTLNYHVVR